ncbi:hypothetical protein HD554DRAFT_2171559 [Boletus coccyginus]|nr:hypothetical protein HD554DRAFT_2171559 [Boletus coccyginus]
MAKAMHGKVDEEAAAVKGLGTETTAEMTDSRSLTTPVSSQELETASQEVNNKTVNTMNLNTTCAKSLELMNTSHNPQDQPLRAQAGRTVEMAEMADEEDGEMAEMSGQVTGVRRATNVNHYVHQAQGDLQGPDQGHKDNGDAKSMNGPRPPEDTGDAMGDDEHHPDTSTELPDQPAGTRGQGGKVWVETRLPGMSRSAKEGAGSNNNNKHQAGKPNKPSTRSQVKLQDHGGIQVELGSKTGKVEHNESVTY